jgi:hypothetical protein
VNVVPASTPAANVNVSFAQTSPSISFTNVALTNDVGQVQIPANTKVTGVVMNAQSSATNPIGSSGPRKWSSSFVVSSDSRQSFVENRPEELVTNRSRVLRGLFFR